MPDQSLGTISAQIRLNLSELDANVAQAKAQVAAMAAAIVGSSREMAVGVGASLGEASAAFAASHAADAEALAQSIAARQRAMEQEAAQATAHARAVSQAMSQVGLVAAAAGTAILGGLGAATNAGSEWEQKLLHISANTNQSREQTEAMRKAVESIGATSAAPLSQIADGYMHVSNFGYDAAQATDILRVATQASVATGADASKVAEVLAGTLHNFGLETSQAGGTMEVLRSAAAKANSTLEQFANAAGPAFANAHTYGISLAETSAAIQVFTQHQFSAGQGATMFAQLLQNVANPTARTTKAIAALGLEHTALAKDFSFTGLQAKGVVGFLTDLDAAAKKAGISAEELARQLLRGRQGGTGAAVLVQNLREYATAAKELETIFEKGAAGIWQYSEANTSLAGQIQILKNNFTILGDEVEQALLPVLTGLLNITHALMAAFMAIPAPIRQMIVVATALIGTLLLVGGGILMLIGQWGSLVLAVEAAGVELGTVTAILTGPVGWAIAGVIAAVALLAAAWSSDFLGIRTTVERFFDWAGPFVRYGAYVITENIKAQLTLLPGIARFIFEEVKAVILSAMQSISNAVQGAITGARVAMDAIVPGAGNALGGLATQVQNTFGAVGNSIHNTITGIRAGLDGARLVAKTVMDDIDRAAAKHAHSGAPGGMPHHSPAGGGGGGKGGGGGAGKHLDDLKRKAEEARKAILETREAIFKLTHDDTENAMHTALNKFNQERGSGVPFMLALKQLTLEYNKIMGDARDKAKEASTEVQNSIFAMTHTSFEVRTREAGQEREKEKKAGVNPNLYWKNYELKLAQIQEDQEKSYQEQLQSYEAFAEAMAGEWKKSADLKDAIENDIQRSSMDYTAEELKAEKARAVEDRKLEEETARIRYELNNADYKDYMRILTEKVNGAKIYSQAWMEAYQKLGEITKKNVERNAADTKKEAGEWHGMLKGMSDTMTNVFQGAFSDLFQKGWKSFFKDVVKGFTDMLEQMLAQLLAKAAIFGILSVLTGGKTGFLGSFGSFLGFDDWGNDRKAVGWGYDYADMFTRGIGQFASQNARTPGSDQAGRRGAEAPAVNIHMHGVNIASNMDVDDVAQKLAWHIQRRQPVYQGRG